MSAPLTAVKADGLLSIADAAAWLAVSESTVKRLLRSGQLPAVRIPGTTLRRISVDALRTFATASSNAR